MSKGIPYFGKSSTYSCCLSFCLQHKQKVYWKRKVGRIPDHTRDVMSRFRIPDYFSDGKVLMTTMLRAMRLHHLLDPVRSRMEMLRVTCLHRHGDIQCIKNQTVASQEEKEVYSKCRSPVCCWGLCTSVTKCESVSSFQQVYYTPQSHCGIPETTASTLN